MHARSLHTHPLVITDTSQEISKLRYSTKGRASLQAPQLITSMEIIFKTEQNGGPSFCGWVGLRRAPGAGWHVTVYVCLLNKRCWPRWNTAIGHLICPTCVIGSCPNIQYSCPIDQEQRWPCIGTKCTKLFLLQVWIEQLHKREKTKHNNLESEIVIYSYHNQ